MLLYDSSLSGHHPDYLKAVLEFARSSASMQCCFMVPEAFVDEHASYASESISFRPLSSAELQDIAALGSHAKADFELQLIHAEVAKATARQQPYEQCMLMYLDYFQPALAAWGKRLEIEFAGVLFQPYTRVEHVATSARLKPGLLLKAWRKRLRLSRMLRTDRVKRICVPCDTRAVDALNHRHSRHARFVMLPEPYFSATDTDERVHPSLPTHASAGPDIRQKYSIAPDKRIVLVFGRMIPRKNVPRIIDAFALLDDAQLNNTVLLVMGTATRQYQAQIQQRVQAASSANPRLQIVCDHSYAEQQWVEAAFAQCDLVAMPYLKAYQSSGVLFLAARYHKPVLAADEGLITELVEQYDLGLCVDVEDTQAIAVAIEQATHRQFFSSSADEFLMRHTAQFHAAVILDSGP